MALLGLVTLLAHKEQLRVVAGHVDHRLRPASGHDADHVRALAGALDVEFERVDLDLAAGSGVPARARAARRQALLDMATARGARVVLLAHTATDQAETVLMHGIRGAGLEGLAGMAVREPWPGDDAARGCWVRPLLGLTRAQTRALAGRLGLGFIDDPTNEDPRHLRVALRTEVLPVLHRFRPQADLALGRVARIAGEAAQALDAWVSREVEERRLEGHPSVGVAAPVLVRGSARGLQHLPRAIRTGIVRRLCFDAGVDPDALTHRVVDAIDAALCDPGEMRSWDLRPHRRLELDPEVLRVVSTSP